MLVFIAHREDCDIVEYGPTRADPSATIELPGVTPRVSTLCTCDFVRVRINNLADDGPGQIFEPHIDNGRFRLP